MEKKAHLPQKCELPRLRGHAWQVSCGGQRRAAGQISESGHRHDVTQPLNCTSPCFMSQIKCHDLSHGTIDQTIDLHAAAARCSSSAASSSSAAPSGPGSSISSSAVKLSIGSTTSCIITKKAPTRAFSWLKAPTSAFTFKTLLRHYANWALTPR